MVPVPGMAAVSDPVATAAAALAVSRHAVSLTGSGTSAESGVPTFRDAQDGLWAQYRPEDLATPEAFERDPGFVWDWYEWRRGIVADVEPNPGHDAIAELQTRLPRVTLITQNVDGLHQRAGSRDVIEFHGNIMRSRCSDEQCSVEQCSVQHCVVDVPRDAESSPPPCPNCGAPIRPDVVWFGEAIPESALEAALSAIADCDVIIVVGTSAQVQPAASLAAQAGALGATLVEINPETTPLSARADIAIRGPSGELLPQIVRALADAGSH
ncbi:MAG: SIR2 family NAD-dependent protein deacylase [Gammaproteobacteria bacterium]